MAYLTSAEVAALIGRSLTSVETTNFDLYESIAESRLANLLCTEDLAEFADEQGKLPVDMQLVLARIFGALKSENSVEPGIQSKKVEDFSITYSESESVFARVAQANNATILKYSKCGAIRHSKTMMTDRRYYHHDRV